MEMGAFVYKNDMHALEIKINDLQTRMQALEKALIQGQYAQSELAQELQTPAKQITSVSPSSTSEQNKFIKKSQVFALVSRTNPARNYILLMKFYAIIEKGSTIFCTSL